MLTRRFDPRRVAVASAILALTAARPAHADDALTRAQVLFEEGRRLMSSGHLDEACPKLAESQKLDPGAGTLLNLALCYEKAERLASAWVIYTEAAAAADRSGRAQWKKQATDKAASLAPRLSTLTIVVPVETAISGLEILRDGTKVTSSELGIKIPVDGGNHTISAQAPSYHPWSTELAVKPRGDAVRVSIPSLERTTSVADAPPATAKPPEPPAAQRVAEPTSEPVPVGASGGGQRVVGIVTAAVGIVAVGVGTYFSLHAMGKEDDALENCSPDARCRNQRGFNDYQDAVDSARGATIALIVGGALLVGGVVLYLTSPRSRASASSAKTKLDSAASFSSVTF